MEFKHFIASDTAIMSSFTKSKLNICGFSRLTYWHGIKGGMDVHGRSISEGLVGRSHRVAILSTRHPSGKRFENKNDVNIHYLPETVFGSRRKGWSAESTASFSRLHRRDPFDIIWSQSFDAFGFTRPGAPGIDIPIIATLHGSIRQEYKTARKNILARGRNPLLSLRYLAGLFYSYFVSHKPLLRRADCIAVVSPTIIDEIARWYGKSLTHKCVTIPNGVNTGLFQVDESLRDRIRKQYGISEKDILLLSLGRLTREKGHHIAAEAVGRLCEKNANVKLLLVGDGPSRRELEAHVGRLSLTERIIFAGSVDHDMTACYYNAADFFIMPSVTIEGLPMVLLEAMACAKPVIASRSGGITFVVQDGVNGLLVDPGDPQQLASKLKWLIENQRLSRRLSAAASQTVRDRFDIDHTVDRLEEILLSLNRSKHQY